jgi:two-component system chemotaxis response regulator CheB
MTTPVVAPPQASPWLITIAASAGGVEAISKVLSALPDDLPAALVIVLHRSPSRRSYLTEILGRVTRMPVVVAQEGQLIRAGVIYVARPDLHLEVSEGKRFSYRDGTRISFTQSSANPLLDTAAGAYGRHLIAVVLTGGGSDATDGVQSVKAHGGQVIAQDQQTAAYPGMPLAAVRSGAVGLVLPLEVIAPTLAALVGGQPSISAAVR